MRPISMMIHQEADNVQVSCTVQQAERQQAQKPLQKLPAIHFFLVCILPSELWQKVSPALV